MKLWDVLATCLLLLSSAVARPLYQNTQPAKRTYFPGSSSDSASLSSEDEEQMFRREKQSLQELSMEDQCKTPTLVNSIHSHAHKQLFPTNYPPPPSPSVSDSQRIVSDAPIRAADQQVIRKIICCFIVAVASYRCQNKPAEPIRA